MKKVFFSAFVLISLVAYSNVRLPKIFGDNMVLQRNKLIPIWGWADPNEKITVQFHNQTKMILAGKNGKWLVKLDMEKAGGPYTLTIKGKSTAVFNNILVGEVWVCSGQSNMEMPIEGWGKINNYEQEVAAANFPWIRQIKVPNTVSVSPQADIPSGEWKVCSPQTAGDFTAVGYFFARDLYEELKVPIGLINTSWGGTMVETWTSREAFQQSSEFKQMIAGMPSLDLDSLAKVRRRAIEKKLEGLQGSFSGQAMTAKEVEADKSKGGTMNLPALWEEKGLEGLDGVVWFRKTIVVPASSAGKAASLELSMIDDNDSTYVNGTFVGSVHSWNTKRVYAIPAGVLKEGNNTILVRVEDTGGGGGIYGDQADLNLVLDGSSISLAGEWWFHVESIWQSASVGPNDYPTLLYNAMVNPLIPYAMRGVIWYQGEANAGRAYQYRKAFPLMITDWRKKWGAGNFPFYFVQLSSFNAGNGNSKVGSGWAELREAQTATLSLPNTGMAVTTDIGNATDIHPKNKQDVGKRLAAIALHSVYGKNRVSNGPVYQSMRVNGKSVIISFTNQGGGLLAKGNDNHLAGFEVAGDDKIFYPATATIDGGKVIVTAAEVSHPVAVRYGWADDAGQANLFNKEGFPASAFRSDKWKGLTESARFQLTR